MEWVGSVNGKGTGILFLGHVSNTTGMSQLKTVNGV